MIYEWLSKRFNSYSNNWIELSEDSDIAELSLKDFDILAFAYGSEEQIESIEPAYEEN